MFHGTVTSVGLKMSLSRRVARFQVDILTVAVDMATLHRFSTGSKFLVGDITGLRLGVMPQPLGPARQTKQQSCDGIGIVFGAALMPKNLGPPEKSHHWISSTGESRSIHAHIKMRDSSTSLFVRLRKCAEHLDPSEAQLPIVSQTQDGLLNGPSNLQC